MRRITLFALCWLAVIVVFARYAISATLQVAPVMLNLNATQRATALYLTNTGSEPIHAQIRVYDWSQSQGKDVLTLTDDIVSSPAVTALKPGSSSWCALWCSTPWSTHRNRASDCWLMSYPAASGWHGAERRPFSAALLHSLVYRQRANGEQS